MKKKKVLLIVRKHVGEIDWILPLLYRLNLNFDIITIFPNLNSFKSLKNNKNVYMIWKKISKKYIILSRTEQFFWRITHRFFLKLKLNAFKSLRRLENKILFNVFNVKKLFYKLNIDIKDVSIILTTFMNASYLSNFIKKENKNINIIRYPESTILFPSKKENPFLKRFNKISNIEGDFFLFSSVSELEFFFGKKIKKDLKKKIIFCGIFRYESWWLQRFKKKVKRTKKFNILIPLRPSNTLFFQKKSFLKFLEIIKRIATKLDDVHIIFKLHPDLDKEKIIKDHLKSFRKNSWEISKRHILDLTNRSDVCIGTMTSACLDTVAMKIPTVDFYDVDYELTNSNFLKHMINVAYDKKNKKWLPIFAYKKVMKNIYEEKNLYNNLLRLKNKKKIFYWQSYKRNFDKFIYFGFNSYMISKFIININKNNS